MLRIYNMYAPSSSQVNVVTESRLYNSWGSGGSGQVDTDSGIIRGKQVLSKLHYEMGRMGFTQVSHTGRLESVQNG